MSILENDTDRYLRANGTLGAGFGTINANLATPGGTSTTWTLPVDLPINGDYSVTAYAVDTANQIDPSTSGATARYASTRVTCRRRCCPTWPRRPRARRSPTSRIFVSGRAEDDIAIAEVEVAIVNSRAST